MKKHTGIKVQYFLTITIKMTIAFLLLAFHFSILAQGNSMWHGKRCAIVLTYDDALNVHLDNVVPLLDSLNLRATFYVPGSFPGFRERINEWRSVAKKGYELGNHTLFHPCEGKSPGREWVQPDYDLNTYTMNRIIDEIDLENTLLEAVDGKTQRTFAYPCGDMKAGDSSYVDKIKKLFLGARSVEEKMEKRDEIDLYNIGCYMINGQSGDEMIDLVKKAMEKSTLLVFLFHGVGGEHTINVTLDAHRKLVYFLKQNEKDLWVAPLVEVAEYVKETSQQKK
jgi:peptidoglycan-N-acetylglucosamine deacetylase